MMLLTLSRSHEVGVTVGAGLPEWEHITLWTPCPFKGPSQTPAVAMLLRELGLGHILEDPG